MSVMEFKRFRLQPVLCKLQLLEKLSKNKHGISHLLENILCTQFYYTGGKKEKIQGSYFPGTVKISKKCKKFLHRGSEVLDFYILAGAQYAAHIITC